MHVALIASDGEIAGVAAVEADFWAAGQSAIQATAAAYHFTTMELEADEGYPSAHVRDLASWRVFVHGTIDSERGELLVEPTQRHTRRRSWGLAS